MIGTIQGYIIIIVQVNIYQLIAMKLIPIVALLVLSISLGTSTACADTFDEQFQLSSGELAYFSVNVNDIDTEILLQINVTSGPNIDVVTLEINNLEPFRSGEYYYYTETSAGNVNSFIGIVHLWPGTYFFVIDNTNRLAASPNGGTAAIDLTITAQNSSFSDITVNTEANFYYYTNTTNVGSNPFDLIVLFFIGISITLTAFRLYRRFLKKKEPPVIDDPKARYVQGEEHHENLEGPLVISICHHCGVQIPQNSNVCYRCGKQQ